MKLIDNPGRTPIANPQLPLQQRRRPELIADTSLGRLAEQRIAVGHIPNASFPTSLLDLFAVTDGSGQWELGASINPNTPIINFGLQALVVDFTVGFPFFVPASVNIWRACLTRSVI